MRAGTVLRNNERTILVVDDDAGQRGLLAEFLSRQGFRIRSADSGERALALLAEETPDLMISDVRMPGITGLEALRQARTTHPSLPVLLVTGYADVRDAVEAMRDGALDYIEKPIDLDELLCLVDRILGIGARSAPPVELPPLPADVVCRSPAMFRALGEAALAAPSEARVLLTGESGTGKEVVARLIHRWSPRAAGPLVTVNCAAIPENLLESEFFGHERGAFTGAVAQRVGRFEEASGGTIFLDEMGEIPLSLQAKLLRVVQDGTYQRVGGNEERCSKARVLAATNRNLEREVVEGRFREDLYYRLNVIEIALAPLRDRLEDIAPLALVFASRFGGGTPRLAPNTLEVLARYPWPGNVRELQNAMERAALMSRGGIILPEHLPARVVREAAESRPAATVAPGGTIDELEREAIRKALREHGHNRTRAAAALGISRRTLIYRLRRYLDEGCDLDGEA
ncbi:MAG: sigma-54 dependent transcriptional regulator [Lentisphaeria bacterium]|jgi:DNA-binding NtrC family response regulator|nr:sigma-54 dependent transcriptional regulator [Lentisphaeria bacterium]